MKTRTSAAVAPLLVLTTTIGTVAWAAWASTGLADATPALTPTSPTADTRLDDDDATHCSSLIDRNSTPFSCADAPTRYWSVASASGSTRSAPARRSWPPTIASVQPEMRRSSSRTPNPGGGVATIRNAPLTLAACWAALAISRCGGRSATRATSSTYGTDSPSATRPPSPERTSPRRTDGTDVTQSTPPARRTSPRAPEQHRARTRRFRARAKLPATTRRRRTAPAPTPARRARPRGSSASRLRRPAPSCERRARSEWSGGAVPRPRPAPDRAVRRTADRRIPSSARNPGARDRRALPGARA